MLGAASALHCASCTRGAPADHAEVEWRVGAVRPRHARVARQKGPMFCELIARPLLFHCGAPSIATGGRAAYMTRPTGPSAAGSVSLFRIPRMPVSVDRHELEPKVVATTIAPPVAPFCGGSFIRETASAARRRPSGVSMWVRCCNKTLLLRRNQTANGRA
jgi:hypothetical protein